jgi:nucleotide-binding universal stress UspA family protein
MKNILVPTDFSETAKCAFFYAHKMAEALGGGTIKLVHVFMPAVESEYPNFVPPVSEFLKIREEMLNEFRKETCGEINHERYPAIKIEQELLIGFPADEISRISSDYDLIVMGTTGDSDLLNNIFGSVSSAVARRADCPVILIPRDMEFEGFNHILYASNYESAEDEMIETVLHFNRPFHASIHFVHVREEGEKEEQYRKSKEEIFNELFEEGEPAFSFQMAEVESDSVEDGLNEYVEKNGIDLVVMVNYRRRFWNSFFHKSQTKRMALTTRIPLMVLHVYED